jgi:hypothetical protein
MAHPWAEATPASDQNTLATIAVNGHSSNVTQIINDGGEKIIQELANRGRIFLVPDAERFSHALLMNDGGSPTIRYRRDEFGAGKAIATASEEIMTNAKFDILARTRNLNFPQDMVGGTLYNYMDNLTRSNAIGMFYELESELALGNATADGANPASVDPYEGDDNYGSTLQNMSFRAITKSSTGYGITADDPTTQSFAGLDSASYPKWKPNYFSSTSTSALAIADFDNAFRSNDYGPLERTTHTWLGLTGFNQLVALVRTTATHNDAMNANLGLDGKIQIGSVVVDWHRMLDTVDVLWDYNQAVTGVACYPIQMYNLNSLRLNIVASGTISDGGYAAQKDPKIGFLKQFPGVHMHPALNSMYKRVSMLSSYSLEHGRRGFSQMDKFKNA